MTTGATGQLGLALPVQGELSGTWGDTVNNGTTQYTNIAIAATLTLTNDGAVTLANTTGDASASNIVSSLTGAGTVTAQFAIVRVTGTLTTAKVVTAPSYSKTYVVVNAATGGIVTFKASGQTGVSIAVGESAWVYFNGTDYVKLAGTVNTGVTSFQTSLSGLTPSTSTTGAVTLAGTLGTSSGGTNLTSFTSGGVVYASSTSALATGSALQFTGTSLLVGTTSATANFNFLATQATDAPAGLMVENTSNTASASAVMRYKSSGSIFAYTGLGSPSRSAYAGLGANILSMYTNGDAGISLVVDNAAGPITFNTNSAEKMRVTPAGNVGIGTSSPAVKLRVQSSDADYISVFQNTNASGYGLQVVTQGSGTNLAFQVRPNVGNTDAFQVLDNGNVGIGTSSPSSKLDVNGAVVISPNTAGKETFRFTTNASDDARLLMKSNTTITVDIQANGSSYFNGGNVGIGTTSPASKLDVTTAYVDPNATAHGTVEFNSNSSFAINKGGSISLGGAYTGTSTTQYGSIIGAKENGTDGNYAGYLAFQTRPNGSTSVERARISSTGGFSVGTTADPGAGAIYATGNITAYYSDKRLKTVSGKIENALDKVAQLSGVYYTNNSVAKSFGYDSDEVQVGVLAQDVEAVLPQIVKAAPFDLDADGNSKSGENYKTVQYERLVPLLIEAINELQAKVKALESK